MELRFVAPESAFDYFASTRSYLERFGKPVALYSEKPSLFRVAASEAKKTAGITQSSLAPSALNMDILSANTRRPRATSNGPTGHSRTGP